MRGVRRALRRRQRDRRFGGDGCGAARRCEERAAHAAQHEEEKYGVEDDERERGALGREERQELGQHDVAEAEFAGPKRREISSSEAAKLEVAR